MAPGGNREAVESPHFAAYAPPVFKKSRPRRVPARAARPNHSPLEYSLWQRQQTVSPCCSRTWLSATGSPQTEQT